MGCRIQQAPTKLIVNEKRQLNRDRWNFSGGKGAGFEISRLFETYKQRISQSRCNPYRQRPSSAAKWIAVSTGISADNINSHSDHACLQIRLPLPSLQFLRIGAFAGYSEWLFLEKISFRSPVAMSRFTGSANIPHPTARTFWSSSPNPASANAPRSSLIPAQDFSTGWSVSI
jgi:hypothetical protein